MARMINVLRFRIDGFIEVDPADPANVVAASETFDAVLTDVGCRAIVTGSGCTFSRMRAIEEVPGPAPGTTPQDDLDIPPIVRRESPDGDRKPGLIRSELDEEPADEQPADDDPLPILSAG